MNLKYKLIQDLNDFLSFLISLREYVLCRMTKGNNSNFYDNKG